MLSEGESGIAERLVVVHWLIVYRIPIPILLLIPIPTNYTGSNESN